MKDLRRPREEIYAGMPEILRCAQDDKETRGERPRVLFMEQSRCYQAALRLLQYRFRSEKELEDRLRQKGFAGEEVAATLVRLREEKWLDDRRFAGEYARTRRLRRRSRLRIGQELRSLGVKSEVAAEALGDEATERETLTLLCQKRIRVLTRTRGPGFVAGNEGRRKLTAYLLRQGYDYATVLQVVEEELGK